MWKKNYVKEEFCVPYDATKIKFAFGSKLGGLIDLDRLVLASFEAEANFVSASKPGGLINW